MTCRAPEAACWLRLGCWSNNSASSHPSHSPFNHRVLHACLVPQCSYPPHRPRHQRRLANCDWMPASYPCGQPSNLAGIQPAELRCNGATLSLARRAVEPGHLLHSALARPSSADARRLKSRHPFVSLTQHLISSSDNNNISAAQGWIINGMRSGRTIRLDRLHTGVGRFRTCLYKWAMASSAACECGTEEQTVDHLVLQCAIHRSPHGLHGLTVLDDETTEWLLNTCPEIWCGQAVV